MALGIELPIFRLGVQLQKKVRHPNHSATEDATHDIPQWKLTITITDSTSLSGITNNVISLGVKLVPQA